MARKTDKKTTSAEEWQGAPFANEEIEFSPFMFDAGQADADQQISSAASGVPAAPESQFSDADMEFEPFMFDQGGGAAPFTPLTDDSVASGPDFAPFSPDPVEGSADSAASTDAVMAESASTKTASGPITGSDLPLPSYLSAATDSAPLTPEARDDSSSMDVTPETLSADSELATPTDPALAMPNVAEPDMDMDSGEQLTGRAPSGPLVELSDTPSMPSTSTSPSLTSTSPSLGRVRGNTGPLGPLPPDRTGAPNTSWSDSSLASIEDFSSILIALHAGKKLRQSGPLGEDMLSQTTLAEDTDAAPASTPEQMGVAAEMENMPEWAVQATQSSPLAPEMAASAAEATLETPATPVDVDTSAPQASVATSEPAVEAQAPQVPAEDPIHYRQVPSDSVLNELEPNVAEALKTMDRSVAPDSLTGDEIEFEGFMFNKGASTPMASLSTPSSEELASISKELGPVFDPALYAGMDNAEAEDAVSYDDMDPTLFEGLSATAQPPTAGGQEAGTDAQGADSKEGLPFWLQFDDAPPASGPLAEEDLPEQYRMSDSSGQSDVAHNEQMSSPASESNDFAELPPIEPFDFSLMPTSSNSESLGFNTEELSGLTPDMDDHMSATINLAAVAALLGGTPSGPLDTPSSGEQNSGPLPESEPSWSSMPQDEQAEMSQYNSGTLDASSGYSPDVAEAEAEVHPSWSQDVAPELDLNTEDYSTSTETPTAQIDAASGWMASATTGLVTDQVDALGDAPAQDTTGLADNGLNTEQNLAVEGLDVAPFDFTQIEVEEEPPTGYLDNQQMQSLYGTVNLEKTDDNAAKSEHDTSFFSAEGESSDHAPATSSLTEPLLADSDHKRKGRATDYLNEDVVADIRQDAGNVAASAEPLDAQSQAVEVPTTPDAADQESQPAIKARVARGPWTAYTETTDLNMPAPQAHTQAQAEAQQSASEAQTETSQPAPAASEASGPLFEQSVRLPSEVDIMTSGPLPSIPGFEDLVSWVADNPQDIGAHMALASAYAQSQDLDSALRIYRRIIKKPTTSETMLRMIWDDLSDLSPHAQHLPRYHQLSGDILLRLGRHREAVEAYNRLQSKDGD
ncbi:MAG TPA: hypothetical protein VLQ48_12600 [Chloroflexia bacterium]|nr:hypothetical protein [Chloroflexia bacterium]